MKTYAKFFGALGAVFLIFGAITSLWLQGGLKAVGVAEFVLGLIGVSLFGFYYLGETLRTISQRRELIYGLSGTLLVLALLIGINVIAQSHWGEKKFDTTANKLHSLSTESANLVKNLSADISVIGFFSKGAKEKPFLEDLVEKYTYVTPKVKYELVDPDVEPAKVKSLDAAPDQVIVRNDVTKKSMKLANMTEEALTTAIKRVMSAQSKTIYFVQGHGEGDLDDDKTSQGLYVAKYLLENEGFTIKPLNLAMDPKIPADASIIAAWGAQRSISKSEVDSLLTYLERGGNLIIGQSPIIAPTKDKLLATGLEPILDRVGLELKPAILLEYQVQLMRGQVINSRLALSDFGQHAITSAFNKQSVVEIFMAGPVLQKTAFKDATVSRTLLASTSKQSWAESDMPSIFIGQKPSPQGDTMGPIPVAQVAEFDITDKVKDPLSKKAKVIVFGDANFAQNALVQNGFNRDFFLNSFNYMGGEEVTLSIRPKTWTSSTLEINETDRRIVYVTSLFGIPQIIMALGIVIWLMRRSRA